MDRANSRNGCRQVRREQSSDCQGNQPGRGEVRHACNLPAEAGGTQPAFAKWLRPVALRSLRERRLVDQPGSNWALGFDLPDKEEPGSEVGGVVFMGGLAHLRCTFRRPWGAHVALYPLPSCRLTSPVVGVAGDWYHSPAYENARHRHLGRLRGCDRRKRKTSRGHLDSGID